MKSIITYLSNIPKDKILHSYCSLAIYCFMYIALYDVLFSALFAILVAAIKEFVDFMQYGWKDQHKDIIADAGGILFGVIFSLLIMLRSNL